ncbi:hypothetical protein ACO2Q1_01740 [Brevundimonas sp. VNH65]|uniref:hypothetical protein n=1 Tax=Brevundimonas sp. VNH65 TaxID=3400917 RepID=UPI003C01EDE4
MTNGANGASPPQGPQRVADMAAHLLRRAAEMSDSLADSNASLAEPFRRNAETYRMMADHVAQDPRGDPVVSGVHVKLEGLVDPTSDRRWSHGEIGARMLRDAAQLAEGLAAQGNPALLDVAALFRQAAMFLSSAPDALLDQELVGLSPYLAACDRVQQGAPIRRVASTQIDRLLAHSEFRAIAARTFELATARGFDTLSEEPQQAWAGNIAAVWMDRHGPPAFDLTSEQDEALAYAVSHPRGPWRLPPLLAGEWTELGPDDALAVMRVVGAAVRLGQTETPVVLHHYCDRVRTRSLACHGGLLAVEIQGYGAGGEPGIISAIVLADGVFIADGTSAPIHNLNDRFGAGLDTPEARRDYALLFLNWVRANDGRFQPLETAHDVDHRLAEPAWARDHLGPLAAPLTELGALPNGGWRLRTPVVHGGGVFIADFQLSPDGQMEMVDDQMLLPSAPIRAEVMDGLLVRLDAPIPPVEFPYDPDALDQ